MMCECTRKHALLVLFVALLMASCTDVPGMPPTNIDAGQRPSPPGKYLDGSLLPSGPSLTITSHSEAPLWENGTLPIDSLLTVDNVEITCLAQRNPNSGLAVAHETVRVAASDGVHTVEAAASPTGDTDTFSATLDISAFRNGVISLWCRARDVAPETEESEAFVLTYLDLGPTIEILSPTENSTYSGSVPVLISIRESPIVAHDPFVDVDDVTMQFGNRTPYIGHRYEVEGGYLIDFSWAFEKGGLGPPPLRETTITVSASMVRSLTPAVRTRSVTFFAAED